MATNRVDLKAILKKFTEPEFLDQIMLKFDKIFNDMNFIDQFVFSKYHRFVADVQSFKTSLLKFVLDAQTHLSVLKDNMASNRFQQLNEEKQLKFIEARLNRINKQLLLEYITSCKRLIATSIDLHNEYDTTLFKVKFVLLNILGFTAIGAAAGFTIGMVLPFLSMIEAGAGALLGAFGGLVFVVYQLVFKWDERMEQIQKVRDNLREIHDCLVDVEKQLQTTYKEVNRSQLELSDQIKQESLLEIRDLQEYIRSTHEQFIKLEQVLLHVKFTEKTN
jgi:hypothetical protein